MVMSLQVRMPGIVPPPPLSGVALDRPMKVIAVDEDQQFRRMLSDELAEYGFDVTTFSDGAALLEAASVALAADLIILDWSLRSSAIDLLSRLREAGVDVPVVFVTGRPLMANEDRAFALGARDFIDKSRGMRRDWHVLKSICIALVCEALSISRVRYRCTMAKRSMAYSILLGA